MLAAPTTTPHPPRGWVAEPKWDGFRALVARWNDGRVLIRSRHGTDMTTGFPEIAAAAAALPEDLGDVLFDGELVIWQTGRLAFEPLLTRLGRTPANARRMAAASPASMVIFDILHLHDQPTTTLIYRERRALLEELFDGPQPLRPPWTLCPASEDPADIDTWLQAWSPLGIEGVCFKDPLMTYRPGSRGWKKYRLRSSTEAVIGAVTGTPDHPESLLLGRFDARGRLRFAGRTSPLPAHTAASLARQLAPAEPGHPWTGRHFRTRWQPSTPARVALVQPDLVAEISADTAMGPDGSWRRLVRLLRTRPDLDPADAPLITDGNEPATG